MPMLTGTTAADSLVGTAADDVINARTSPAGSDSLYGGDGADLLYGGAEPGDTNIDAALYGGAGADTLSFEFVSPAGTHSVLLSGGDGADRIVILSSAPLVGSVTVDGGAGDDTLIGSATALDQVTRVNVEHLLVTPADIGDTKIDLTADQVRAMNGSIGIDGSFAAHLFIDITSGSGAIDFTAATTGLDLTAADGLTSITGSRYGDYIHNVVNAAVDGGGGDDNIVALSGTVSGGTGNDTISVVADSPNSRLDGGDGYDRLNLAVDINGASIAIDSLDIASGAPLTALNGGTIRNFEVLSALITRGDGDTITAGTRSTNIETWGDHNVVNASANTSYIYMHGGSGSGNVAHVVPAGVGQQVHLLDAAGVGPDGFVDLNYAAATGSVHFGGDTVLGANQGGVFVQGDVYVGDSPSAASSSATIVGSQIEVTGGAHDDVLQGAPAYFGPREELHGGAGNDTIIAGPTVDLVDAGEGHDTLSFNVQLYQYLGPAYPPAGATIDLAVTGVQATGVGTFSVSGVEDVIGSAGSDALRGDASDNALSGLGGDDALYGGAGNDTLEGGAGDDTLDGGAGLDVAKFGFAHDYALTLNAGSGTMTSTTGTDTLSSIETLQFLDGQLSFDTGSTAAQILRLYDSFLGRTPDVEGFNSYLKFFADGHTFQDMADNAAASPEFHDATAQLTDAEYITYVYEHSLHREPEAWGLQQYEAALANGTLTRTSMIVQAAESPEHIALTAPEVAMGLWVPDQAVEGLELLFDGGLYRKPTVAEIATYKAELASGVSFRQIAHELANSSEFQSLHGVQTDAEFINGLYVTELGHNAEPTGLQAYIAELVHGETRGDILYETAFSQTHQNLVLAHYDPLLVSV